MLDTQPSAAEDLIGPVVSPEGKPHKSPEEKDKKAKKAAEEAEKEYEKAVKLADRWEKQQDRLAKLHLDGDKLLLRWLRTSLFLVTTGIGIERGLKYLEGGRAGPSLDPYAVLRLVGLGFVLIGLGALLVACVEHRERLRVIRQGDPPPVPDFALSLWVSVAVAILSVIAFIAAVVSFENGRMPLG